MSSREEFFRQLLTSHSLGVVMVGYPNGESVYVHPSFVSGTCKIFNGNDVEIDTEKCPHDLFLALMVHIYAHDPDAVIDVDFDDVHRFAAMKTYLQCSVPVRIAFFPEISIFSMREWPSKKVQQHINERMGCTLLSSFDFHLDGRDEHITYYDMINDDMYPSHSHIIINGEDMLKRVYRNGTATVMRELLMKHLSL